MKHIIYLIALCALMCGCSVYRTYERPDDLPVDSLYRKDAVSQLASDTTSLGDLPWKEVFRDTVLQRLIEFGLSNNTDMQVALLRLDQAQAKLTSAKLAYLPSLTLSPQGSVSKSNGSSAVKSYQIPLQAEWEIDLFGKLRNAKKEAQATMLEQRAYCRAVQSELIANIANSYYSLLMLDEQLKITDNTIALWKEQVRTMESMWKVGETTENAVTSAQANLTQPIFNRGKLISNLRVSKDEGQIALLNYKQALLDAGQEVNNALYTCESGRKLI